MTEQFNQLLVASNRLPIVLKRDKDSWRMEPGSGGLVTALTPLMQKHAGTWVGWPGITDESDLVSPMQDFSAQQGYALHPVHLQAEDIQGYYYGFPMKFSGLCCTVFTPSAISSRDTGPPMPGSMSNLLKSW